VLDAASQGLADLPGELDEERVAVDEVLHMAKMADDPILDSRITFSGEMAEGIRAVLAAVPVDKLESRFVADYMRLYPSLHSLVPMRVEEQEGRNALTLVQQFAIPNFWRFPEQRMLVGEVGLWSIVQNLQVPAGPRKQPFRFEYPGIYRHTIAIQLPDDLTRPGTRRSSESDPYFDFQLRFDATSRGATMVSELHVLKKQVAVADWDAYNAKLAKLRPQLASMIMVPALKPADGEKVRAQVMQLTAAMGKGERGVRAVTQVQADARIRLALLTAQLDSGFLNPRLRSEALVERAIQRDHLGMADQAVPDYDEAMRLVPDSREAIAGAAVNALLRGDSARARELSQRALQLAPSDPDVRNTLGYANYFNADYRASIDDWKTLLNDRSARERGYPAIWLYLSTRRSGEDGVAAVKPFLPAQAAPEWPNQVLQWFAGTASYDQALKVAEENPKDPSRLCELYFYAGEKYLLDGDAGKAKEYFRKSVGTGVTEFNEYNMARHELAKLGN
jgi:lipoprotein NlpI